MIRVLTPPNFLLLRRDHVSVFLAGSIEMSKAVDWQSEVIERLAYLDRVTFLNPRRPDWDSSWKQDKDDPQFSQQVKWELEGLERADFIALYLAPGTVSPISLLELGLHLRTGKVILCCPSGFARKGNVDITAARYKTPVLETMDEFIIKLSESVRLRLDTKPVMPLFCPVGIDSG